MKDYKRIDEYPYIIHKVYQQYYIVDERTGFELGIYSNSKDAVRVATYLNNQIEKSEENKFSDR